LAEVDLGGPASLRGRKDADEEEVCLRLSRAQAPGQSHQQHQDASVHDSVSRGEHAGHPAFRIPTAGWIVQKWLLRLAPDRNRLRPARAKESPWNSSKDST